MKHSEGKLTAKQESALLALLTASTMADAAKSCGVNEVTLWRWQQEPCFIAAYASARRKAMEQALTTLQKATAEATSALVSIVADTNVPPAARVSAARSILEYAFKSSEMIETEARLSALETALNLEGKGK